MIVAADAERRDQLVARWAVDHEVVVVRSPLELIRRCENDGPLISTVVLADVVGSACPADLADFLDQMYPYVRVIVDLQPRSSRDETRYALEAQA